MKFKQALLLLLLLLLGIKEVSARRHKYHGLPRTEAELMKSVITCLQNKDTAAYYYQFPPFDTLWHLVMHNNDNSPEVMKALAILKEDPKILIDFDPHYNPSILGHFAYVLQKGEDSGIHWHNIVMQRFEVQKLELDHSAIKGYEVIAPERFRGFLFVRDLIGRQTFCITITEIQKIKGFYFGGQLLNIFQANNIDEYFMKEEFEKNYIAKMSMIDSSDIRASLDSIKRDSLKTDSLKNGWIYKLSDTTNKNTIKDSSKNYLDVNIADDEKPKLRKEVVDRKYYEGKFDEDIQVELFVRYMKNLSNGKIAFWDGLYKIGDQENYIKLEISKSADGLWEFDDDPPLGSMELRLKDKTYTGTWTNNENQTGYDVVLKQAPIAQQKLEMLENILEKDLTTDSDQDSKDKNKGKTKKKRVNIEAERGNDTN